jgi:hypothetical protein
MATVLLVIYFVTGWDWPWKIAVTIGLGVIVIGGISGGVLYSKTCQNSK